jgi:maltose O-acetyltransferase
MSSARANTREGPGELYDPSLPELQAGRTRARELLTRYNSTPQEALLAELFGAAPPGTVVEPPFHCDYGSNIAVGVRFYANADCVFLDCAPITIGDHVLLGPGVHLYAATHPLHPQTRRQGLEYALPIVVGDDVWLGGGTIVLAGVTIGDRSVIGAGSVVTRDVPADVVAAGNPCRVLRDLDGGG